MIHNFSGPTTIRMSSPASALARHRLLSPSAGVRVSPLCLGTMTFGEAHSERYGKCSKETAFAIMDSFFKNGGNYLDTANTRVERFCKLLFFDH